MAATVVVYGLFTDHLAAFFGRIEAAQASAGVLALLRPYVSEDGLGGVTALLTLCASRPSSTSPSSGPSTASGSATGTGNCRGCEVKFPPEADDLASRPARESEI